MTRVKGALISDDDDDDDIISETIKGSSQRTSNSPPTSTTRNVESDSVVRRTGQGLGGGGDDKALECSDNTEVTSATTAVVNDDQEEQSESQGRDEKEEEIESTCYCGVGRKVGTVELQCVSCMKWFHEQCIKIDIRPCLPFMTSYVFVCRVCSGTTIETFSKKQATFYQKCLTALANLTYRHRESKATFFTKEKLIAFIDRHWESLTTVQRRIKQTWHVTIVKTMMKDNEVFVCKESPLGSGIEADDYPQFALSDPDLSHICPNYEALKLTSNQKSGVQDNNSLNMSGNGSLQSIGKSRTAKRKNLDSFQTTTVSKKSKSEFLSQKLPSHGFPLEHPFNKDGYRYTLAEIDPHAPHEEFDASDQFTGKPIPAYLYRVALHPQVLLALHDRAPQIKISEDRLSATGEKGYSVVRATHGVRRGEWYYEVTIVDMPREAATRLGWAQNLANLQAPLGYDKFSYSWRSRKGTVFHQSHGSHFSTEGYNTGDVIGFYIDLPGDVTDTVLPDNHKKQALIKFKNYLYFEEKDQVAEVQNNLKILPNSKICLYKNGVNQGAVWTNVYEGEYFPAASLYKNSTVRFNFGPDFKYPPTDYSSYKPMCDTVLPHLVQHLMSDMLWHVDFELAGGILQL